MITSSSKKLIRRSFEKVTYRFAEAPEPKFRGNFGIYVHVPFCRSICTFCPFYKELYSEGGKNRYVDAIVREISGTDMSGSATWVYFGGGTPNTLSIEEMSRIVGALREKVQLGRMGIELLPNIVTKKYLDGLKTIGFSKVSVGIESLSDEVVGKTGRKNPGAERTREIVSHARSLGLWVNADMMIGLPGQNPENFKKDISLVSEIGPTQVTIYPFMKIRGVKAAPSSPEEEQFRLIEEAAKTLESAGYRRKSVWVFAKGDDVYDSSRDELVEDYAGFGPAAFSTYGNWKVVNPDLASYLKCDEKGSRLAFVAEKSKGTDDWRKFSRMIYDLNCKSSREFPAYMNAYLGILKLAGFAKRGALTEKGKIFAHAITKTVVESLPFPVQNRACVENYPDYAAFSEYARIKKRSP